MAQLKMMLSIFDGSFSQHGSLKQVNNTFLERQHNIMENVPLKQTSLAEDLGTSN